MAEILPILLKISLVLYITGSLLGMGLRLKLEDALGGLRNLRFVTLGLVWGFVLCPALAYLLTRIIPLEQAYAIGLILLGMVPCAPFLPMMVDKARGDLGYAAAFMLLAAVVMVVYLPLMVPVVAAGLTVNAWTIAKPLLFLVLVPMVIGMAILRASEPVAARIHPFIKKTTDVATIVMLVLCVIIYGKAFVGMAGSFAIGTQILFFSIVSIASYGLAFGLQQRQRSVLSLGLTMRNLGAALAPLFSIPDVDQRSIIMVVLAVPMQLTAGWLAANWFARHAFIGEQGATPGAKEGLAKG